MDIDKDFEEYYKAWLRKMVEIWQEKIEERHIIDTGALHNSFKTFLDNATHDTRLTMKFAKYGIYQALGVGYGYRYRYTNPKRDHVQAGESRNGNLPSLDSEYRHLHHLDRKRKTGPAWGGKMTSGKPRSRRDWMSKKLYMSVMAMREDLVRIAGDELTGVICAAMEDINSTIRM